VVGAGHHMIPGCCVGVVWTTKDREVTAAAVVEAGRAEENLGTLIEGFGLFARPEPLRQAGNTDCWMGGKSEWPSSYQ
jgi:myo-inositol catabolism protein IolC